MRGDAERHTTRTSQRAADAARLSQLGHQTPSVHDGFGLDSESPRKSWLLDDPLSSVPCVQRSPSAGTSRPQQQQQQQHRQQQHRPPPRDAGSSSAEFPFWPPAPTVYVTALLDVWPPDKERAFWQSNTWRESARNLDKFFVAYAAVNNIIMLLYVHLLPTGICPHLRTFALVYITLAVLQSALAAHGGPVYFRWRSSLLVANRALRFINIVMDIASCYHSAQIPTFPNILASHMQRPGLGFVGAASRSLIMLSWVFPTLAHTLYLRFTFRLQAAAQLAYLLLLVRYMSAPAAHLLSDPFFAPSLTRICNTIDTLSTSVVADIVRFPPASRAVCGSPHQPWVLVLFVQVSFAFVLPLTVAYCGERRCKLRYIERELRVPALVVRRPWEPLVQVAKLATLQAVYAALVWLLVKEYHRYLAHWVVCLEWPGAPSQWYHSLVA